jgi:hypothetical protein
MFRQQILKKLRKYIKAQPPSLQNQRDTNSFERYSKNSNSKVAFIVTFTGNQQL